ncbi:MAG: hypothetical protein WBL63_12490, partial [Candidatus Acidiferrum sp.]
GRSQKDKKFHRLLLRLLSTLVWLPSSVEDRIAACKLADRILQRAGTSGRQELKDRLRSAGYGY